MIYNEVVHPHCYRQEFFSINGHDSNVSRRAVFYSKDHRIDGLQYYNADGTKGTRIDFASYNEFNRVTESLHYDKDENFLRREVYESNEDGNNLTKTIYTSISGDDEPNILESNSYTYTSFGSLDNRTENQQTYGIQEYEYTYRQDNNIEENKKK